MLMNDSLLGPLLPLRCRRDAIVAPACVQTGSYLCSSVIMFDMTSQRIRKTVLSLYATTHFDACGKWTAMAFFEALLAPLFLRGSGSCLTFSNDAGPTMDFDLVLAEVGGAVSAGIHPCLLYTSPSPRD